MKSFLCTDRAEPLVAATAGGVLASLVGVPLELIKVLPLF